MKTTLALVFAIAAIAGALLAQPTPTPTPTPTLTTAMMTITDLHTYKNDGKGHLIEVPPSTFVEPLWYYSDGPIAATAPSMWSITTTALTVTGIFDEQGRPFKPAKPEQCKATLETADGRRWTAEWKEIKP